MNKQLGPRVLGAGHMVLKLVTMVAKTSNRSTCRRYVLDDEDFNN